MLTTAWNPDYPIREEPAPIESRDTCARPSTAKRVLLAEDDDEVRALVAQFLRSSGYEVVEVAGGLDLYNHLGECLFEGTAAPDVIVCDVRMPSFSGLEVLRSARCAALDMPFILMTAYGDASTRAEAAEAGAVVVLDKPFELDDLLDAVARFASAGDAERPR